MRSAEDDWEDLSPSSIALAASWPLLAGEHVELHGDECAIYEGRRCSCDPLPLNGPTEFA